LFTAAVNESVHMTRSKIHSLLIAGLLWLISCHSIAQPEAVPALAAWQQLIDTLRASQNPINVDAQLSEAYAGLGNSLQTLEQHADAIAAYDQALQLLRENKGLYTLDQLPVLQARLESSQALANWQEVDAGRQLAWLITMKNPDTSSELRYQTLRELGLWKLRAAEEDLLPNSLEDAREMSELYRQQLAQPDLRAAYQGRALSLANVYLDLAALEFLQAKQQLELPLSSFGVNGQRTVSEMFCESIPTPDGRMRQVCRNVQVPNMDYFMSLSDRRYGATWDHLNAMEDAVLEAWKVLLPEVETQNRDAALTLLTEVHRLTDTFNDFVAKNARKRTGSRIAAPTGSKIRR
jgi:tetratricopeptide (TPR) repeat protein